MKPFIINDGTDYYVIEAINASTAKEKQELFKNGELKDFSPIYRFTFFDKFRNAYYGS